MVGFQLNVTPVSSTCVRTGEINTKELSPRIPVPPTWSLEPAPCSAFSDSIAGIRQYGTLCFCETTPLLTDAALAVKVTSAPAPTWAANDSGQNKNETEPVSPTVILVPSVMESAASTMRGAFAPGSWIFALPLTDVTMPTVLFWARLVVMNSETNVRIEMNGFNFIWLLKAEECRRNQGTCLATARVLSSCLLCLPK